MRRTITILALALMATACGDDGTSPDEPQATFTLTEVNGAPPPALGILWENGDSTIFESARFELMSATRFRYHEVRVEVRDGERIVLDRVRTGRYENEGDVLWFHMPEGSSDNPYINVDSMDFDGETITDWYGSAYLVYTRDAEAE